MVDCRERYMSQEDFDRLTAAEGDCALWQTKYEAIRNERDKNLPYSINLQQQTCKVCGRPMKLDFHVHDIIWKMVVPEEHRNHAICLYCFDEYAARMGLGVSIDIDDIYFAGKAVQLRLRKGLARSEREGD